MRRVNVRYYHGHNEKSYQIKKSINTLANRFPVDPCDFDDHVSHLMDLSREMTLHRKASNLLRKVDHREYIYPSEHDQKLHKFIDYWRFNKLESNDIYKKYDEFFKLVKDKDKDNDRCRLE